MADNLIDQALRARQAAYAPYSHFAVGAAVLAGGQVFTGCNIENASFGLSICAERVAIFKAVAAGHQQIEKLAVAADTKGPVAPCGACRQVMREFMAPTALVLLANVAGQTQTTTVQALLPGAFLKEDF